jgi:hypothetical protein
MAFNGNFGNNMIGGEHVFREFETRRHSEISIKSFINHGRLCYSRSALD